MVDITKLSLQEIYRLAEDENTSPKVLRLLSKKKNNSILQRLASNPNSPISVLEKLSFQFPDEVINNPVCALLYLENLKQMDFLNIAMAKSESTSEDELIKLAKNNNNEIHNILLERKNLSVPVLKIILDKPNWHIYRTIANSQNISVETLRYSANHSNISVRKSVAENKNTPREILQKLATDSEKSVREQVAQNKNTPIDILNFLVKDTALSVVSFVAANPNTSVNTLKLLATDSEPLVRKEVARNINTPLSILKQLFLDSHSGVRLSIVENENLPKDFLKKIDPVDRIKFLNFYTHDKAITIIKRFVFLDRNNNQINEPITLDVSILNNISQSVGMFIVRSFNFSDKTQQELYDYDGMNQTCIHIALAQNPDTSPYILSKLLRNSCEFVLQALAKNINTPVTILTLLAEDKDLSVRKTITDYTIYNPQVPIALLEHLATDSFWLVRRKVANLSHIPTHILEQLANDDCPYVRMGVAYNINCPLAIFEKLKQDDNKHVRLSAAKRLNNDVSVLEYFAQDTEWLVRNEVAKHCNTPLKILQELARDENKYVRDSAIKSPNN